MKSNDDSFLTSLLQYHTRLIDQQFVDGIIDNVKAKKKFRIRAMIVAMVLAFMVAIPLLINQSEGVGFFNEFTSLSPYIITFLLLSTLGFGAWLSSEDF